MENMENDTQTPETAPVDSQFLSTTTFENFDLPEEVRQGLRDAGFTHCTRIQDLAIPVALMGKDIAGQAQTGTGKTGAFLVPMFTRLLRVEPRKPGLPRALIVAPTRELALQIHDEAKVIGRHTDFTFALVIGGIDYKKQADTLRAGADIVICTPGRIIDYQKQGIFRTEGVESVVIDEADRLLDLGFAKDMRFILRKLPHFEKRQSMLFSATLSYRVLELTYEYMNLPEFLSVTSKEVAVDTVEQVLLHVGKHQKLGALLGILEQEDFERLLVFSNTKSGVNFLAHKISHNGYKAEGITGDIPQKQRLSLMRRFKNGDLSVLVATDVASRGLHVEDISHVINYDLPQDPENYIHRIGRTARAGKKGKAYSLACEDYVEHLEAIEEILKGSIEVWWPEEDFYKKDQAPPYKPEKKPRRDARDGKGRGKPGGKKAGARKGPAGRQEKPAAAAEGGDKPGTKKRRRRPKRKSGSGNGQPKASKQTNE
ncbi:MAG: DEAD/DEAH box helicase [Desulfatibacillaceae bacterium]